MIDGGDNITVGGKFVVEGRVTGFCSGGSMREHDQRIGSTSIVGIPEFHSQSPLFAAIGVGLHPVRVGIGVCDCSDLKLSGGGNRAMLRKDKRGSQANKGKEQGEDRTQDDSLSSKLLLCDDAVSRQRRFEDERDDQ